MTALAESISNGNMKEWGSTTNTWDEVNRLVAINGTSVDASYKYDALGRRIEKTINGTTTRYLYDGADIVLEMNESNVATAYYIRTLNIDEPLARIELDSGGNVTGIRFYLADALGSTIALTDENGDIRTRYNYTPFGEVEVSGDSSDNPFMFTGREYDAGTGLYYYRARYYSWELGRFISEDPIGLAGGINMYAYVGNSPLNFVDPLGLDANTLTYGEIRSWAITSMRNYSAPAGLASAKASIAAACSRGNRCTSVNGATAAIMPADQAAWGNIVNATGGSDLSGGGNLMCVGTQSCLYVNSCYTCSNGVRTLTNRANNLQPCGTATVAGKGTLYFYNDPLMGWCTNTDYVAGCN